MSTVYSYIHTEESPFAMDTASALSSTDAITSFITIVSRLRTRTRRVVRRTNMNAIRLTQQQLLWLAKATFPQFDGNCFSA